MRVSSVLVGFVGAAAGAVAAVAGYQNSSVVTESSDHDSAVPAVGRPLPAAPPRIRIRLAGCTPPSRLVHGACVTSAERTVVVYDLDPQPASLPVSTPQPDVPARSTALTDDEENDSEADEETESQEDEMEQEQEDQGDEDAAESAESPAESGDD